MLQFTARSIASIFKGMKDDARDREPLQDIDLDNGAGVIVNLLLCVASAIKTHEDSFSDLVQAIEARAQELIPGIPRWYAAESLIYQHGDSLVYNEGNLEYLTEEPDRQIVKLAAADIINGYLSLKVAALNADGTARQLTDVELSGFMGYWGVKKFACTPIVFVNEPADVARLQLRIGVDSTVIDPATGQLILNPSTYPIEDAVINHLLTYQAENFNSLFKVSQLIDAIQSVNGVINPVPESIKIRAASGSSSDFIELLDVPNEEYLAAAGYIESDTLDPYTLRDLISYYDAL